MKNSKVEASITYDSRVNGQKDIFFPREYDN